MIDVIENNKSNQMKTKMTRSKEDAIIRQKIEQLSLITMKEGKALGCTSVEQLFAHPSFQKHQIFSIMKQLVSCKAIDADLLNLGLSS